MAPPAKRQGSAAAAPKAKTPKTEHESVIEKMLPTGVEPAAAAEGATEVAPAAPAAEPTLPEEAAETPEAEEPEKAAPAAAEIKAKPAEEAVKKEQRKGSPPSPNPLSRSSSASTLSAATLVMAPSAAAGAKEEEEKAKNLCLLKAAAEREGAKPFSFTALLEMDTSVDQTQYINTWAANAKCWVDRALLAFLKERPTKSGSLCPTT